MTKEEKLAWLKKMRAGKIAKALRDEKKKTRLLEALEKYGIGVTDLEKIAKEKELTGKQYRACRLLAWGLLEDEQISSELGISIKKLRGWKNKGNFQRYYKYLITLLQNKDIQKIYKSMADSILPRLMANFKKRVDEGELDTYSLDAVARITQRMTIVRKELISSQDNMKSNMPSFEALRSAYKRAKEKETEKTVENKKAKRIKLKKKKL